MQKGLNFISYLYYICIPFQICWTLDWTNMTEKKKQTIFGQNLLDWSSVQGTYWLFPQVWGKNAAILSSLPQPHSTFKLSVYFHFVLWQCERRVVAGAMLEFWENSWKSTCETDQTFAKKEVANEDIFKSNQDRRNPRQKKISCRKKQVKDFHHQSKKKLAYLFR